MSDIEFEVRGWKAEFRNAIEDLSEITGLLNLQSLKHLDLSNNRIKDIKELASLKNLKYLFLANNQIEDEKNIKFLKGIKNLAYLDISSNKIAYCSDNFIFNKNIEIKVQNFGYFR
ncbi:MAG: leucine-rich repeat protein [Candidatus Lokiarchaeota archaeon]|nr:leucine-rich repeat protein [Candidatus Lokiarchaeota archaeon]